MFRPFVSFYRRLFNVYVIFRKCEQGGHVRRVRVGEFRVLYRFLFRANGPVLLLDVGCNVWLRRFRVIVGCAYLLGYLIRGRGQSSPSSSSSGVATTRAGPNKRVIYAHRRDRQVRFSWYPVS